MRFGVCNEVCKTKQGLGKRYGLGTKRGPGEKQGLTERQTASYQGAFEAVLAVPIAVGFGYGCDSYFDSAPIGLLVGAGIGFVAMLLRIVRMRPTETDLANVAKQSDAKPAAKTIVQREPAGRTEEATESSSTANRPESDQESDR